LLSAIRTFNENDGKFSSYANVCIDNRIKSVFGRKLSDGNKYVALSDGNFNISLTPDRHLTEELVIEKENETEIAGFLSEILSETELKVFNLYLNSYSYNAIASRLSISVKSVDNALSRARGKLRKASQGFGKLGKFGKFGRIGSSGKINGK
jgi:RNA polymerase sporulation-specific sigma factor